MTEDHRGAIATMRVLHGERPDILDRDRPADPRDSGWTFRMADDPTDESGWMAVAHVVGIGHVTDRWPEVERVVARDRMGEWRWDGTDYRPVH
jgi:hypothetical protein